MRKGTVDIDTLVTSRNSDRKIMQFITITSRHPSSSDEHLPNKYLLKRLKLATFQL